MLLFLAACGSSGGVGDIFGGGSKNDYEIRGTVDYVDTNARVVYLTNVTGYNNMLSNGGSSSSVRVYYDNDTTVGYQGQTYRVADLERGDEISVQVDESGNQLRAESMTVLRDVSYGTSGSSTYPGSGSVYDSTIRGTVRYIDTSRRTIEIDRGGGSLLTVGYETSTPVYWNNQTYRATDLERGDEIEVRLTSSGNLARDITVLRNVSSGTSGGSTSSRLSTIRGTVRYVDTSARTIELESASWRNNFNSGGANTSSRVIVSYGSNTNVDVGGNLHPVSGLERGDVIEVQVSNPNATTPFAERIFLVRDVRN